MNFFKSLLKSGSHITSNSSLVCENVHHHEVFAKEKKFNVAPHIKKMNATLTGAKDEGGKKEAMANLLLLLPQCSAELMAEEGERWIRVCMQNLEGACDADFVSSLFMAMTFIVSRCHDNKNHCNKISKICSSVLPKVFSSNVQHCNAFVTFLYEFLSVFPLQALSNKSRIEALIMPALIAPLSPDTESVCQAARVFAVLPVPGASGGGGGLAQAKGRQLGQLVSLAHSAVDVLFGGVKENEEYEFPRNHNLPITALETSLEFNEPIRALVTAATLIGNSFVFIQEFLEHSSSDFVELSRKDLIRLVFRVLQVEGSSLKSASSLEGAALQFLLPSIHLRALALLRALVNNEVCGNFLSLVLEQVVFTLRATNLKGKGKTSPSLFAVRHLCYLTLIDALKVSKCFVPAVLEDLIPSIVMDTESSKSSIELKAATRGGRLSLMKARKKTKKKGYTVAEDGASEAQGGANGSSSSSSSQGHAQNESQREIVAVAAFSLVETIFTFANDSLTIRIVRALHKHLSTLMQSRHWVYTSPDVRASFYSALVASALFPHPLCPPSYALLYPVFQRGAGETHSAVSTVCQRGLAALSFVMANPGVVNASDVARLKSTLAEPDSEDLLVERNGFLENGDCSEEECDNETGSQRSQEESEDEDEEEGMEREEEKEMTNGGGERKDEKNDERESNNEGECIEKEEESVVMEEEQKVSSEEEDDDSSMDEDEARAESESADLKRKLDEKSEINKKIKISVPQEGQNLEELSAMLSSFVDEDPDSE